MPQVSRERAQFQQRQFQLVVERPAWVVATLPRKSSLVLADGIPMKTVKILAATAVLPLVLMTAQAFGFGETHNKECQDAWYRSQAYPTCSGWGWTERQADMCVFRQTWANGGGPKPAKTNALPSVFEYSRATDGTYQVPIDKVRELNNCSGVLVAGNCPK